VRCILSYASPKDWDRNDGGAVCPIAAEKATVLVTVPRLLTNVVPTGVAPVGKVIWGDTGVSLPPGSSGQWRDLISGEFVAGGEDIAVGDVFQSFPVAVLVQQTQSARLTFRLAEGPSPSRI
jgi:maltooligosyltrehalose synthase